jgi:hypothetical protein
MKNIFIKPTAPLAPAQPTVSSSTATMPSQQLAQHLTSVSSDELARLRQNDAIIRALWDSQLREGDFAGYLGTFQSRQQLKPFQSIAHKLRDVEYWKLLREVWSRFLDDMPDLKTWLRLFESKRPGRDRCMTASERATLAAMPDSIEIWRGCGNESAVRGIAWTTDKRQAVSTADDCSASSRFRSMGISDSAPTIVQATCHKSDVLAYLVDQWGEKPTIIINPKKLTICRTLSLIEMVYHLIENEAHKENQIKSPA